MSPITKQAIIASVRARKKAKIERTQWVGGPQGISPTPALHQSVFWPVGDAEYVAADTASLADIAHVNALAASEHFEVGVGWVA